VLAVTTDGDRSLLRESPFEDRQLSKERFVRFVEKLIAPLNRGPQAALPVGKVARPALQDRQAVTSPSWSSQNSPLN
jgi:hypothetical protein